MPSFPATRLRRTRQSAWIRSLTAEHTLSVHDLIWPVFVAERADDCGAVGSLPGVTRYDRKQLVQAAKDAAALGIPAIALFPCVDPAKKCAFGKEAVNANNLVCEAIKAVKDAVPQLGVICDVALDPYTSHGQDGLLRDGTIINDDTVELLCEQALVMAHAGCDVLAPSDMMDGRVGAIRFTMENHGFHDMLILAYAAKYASAFYGPFRDAVGSAAALGGADKKTYQMHPANIDEALCEVAMDIEEGADMVMVKPGMPYLDVVARVAQEFRVPVLAYQVSGEYAMLKAAAAQGAFDCNTAMLESLLAFKRAGASGVFTYAALDMAQLLNA